MNDAHKKVMDMINRKVKKTAKQKENTAGLDSVEQIVFKFFKMIEGVQQASKNALDFKGGLDRHTEILYSRLRSVDKGVKVTIHWNQEESVDSWNNLKITGVTISWSSQFLALNKDYTPTKYIDIVEVIFME